MVSTGWGRLEFRGLGGGQENEFTTAVLGPGGFVVTRLRWLIFTETNGTNATRVNSFTSEKFPDTLSAVLPQRAIVFLSTSLIAVAVHFQKMSRIGFQMAGYGADLLHLTRLDIGFVEVEVNRLSGELGGVRDGFIKIIAA